MSLKNFIDEFKIFLLKRNAIDMALGIILGVSFGKVVSSLVDDIITPPIGFVIGGVTFPNLKIVIKQAINQNGMIIEPEIAIRYGHFLQTIFDFIIIALTSFLTIKFINRIIHKNNEFDWSEYIKKQ